MAESKKGEAKRLEQRHGLVDPAERVLESFELSTADKLWVRVGSFDDTAVVRIKPFEEVELAVGTLFPPKD